MTAVNPLQDLVKREYQSVEDLIDSVEKVIAFLRDSDTSHEFYSVNERLLVGRLFPQLPERLRQEYDRVYDAMMAEKRVDYCEFARITLDKSLGRRETKTGQMRRDERDDEVERRAYRVSEEDECLEAVHAER